MAKRIPLDGEWTLSAPAPAFAGEQTGLSLPVRVPGSILQALRSKGLVWGGERNGEWVYLRSWSLSKAIARPEDPPGGGSEKYFLYMGSFRGRGELFSNGMSLGRLSPFCQTELSQGILDGECALELRFSPALLEGESALPALADAPVLVCCYFARIVHAVCAWETDGHLGVHVRLQAFGEGRVQFRLHLMQGDTLRASLTEERRLLAREQTLFFSMEIPPFEEREVCTLYVRVDRAGARCDSTELLLLPRSEEPAKTPPFFPVLADGEDSPSFEGLRALGIRGALLLCLPPQEVLRALDREGLCAWLLTAKGSEMDKEALQRGFFPHPCARFAGGLGYRFADGSPADSRDPSLFSLEKRLEFPGLQTAHLTTVESLRSEGTPGFLHAMWLYAVLTRARYEKKRLALPLSLLNRGEDPSMEEAAVRAALSPFSLYIHRSAAAPLPGMPLRLTLFPLGCVEGACVLEVRISEFGGRRLKDGAFTLCSFSDLSLPLRLEAAAPWPLDAPLLLRLRLRRGDACLWQWDEPLFFEGCDTAQLPQAKVSVAQSGKSWYAVNHGKTAAAGILCLPGPRLACLLPGEELAAERIWSGLNADLLSPEDEHVSY